ncbi:hypothetical protein [uncultured Flavobacterium sp.]|uniref:hypothetical protein n=1 Tax=uncultured Flavobacterium sp. TaxID=165435 RepID=UPI0025E6479C|nr:hypothetical protein [uncultured Flavobacterium sp.]
MNNKKSVLFFCLAFIPLFIVVANMTLWIVTATGNNDTFEQTRANYLSHFPEWLQNPILLTLIDIALLAIAGGLFFYSMKNLKLKIPAAIFLIFSAILAAWNLFSLM